MVENLTDQPYKKNLKIVYTFIAVIAISIVLAIIAGEKWVEGGEDPAIAYIFLNMFLIAAYIIADAICWSHYRLLCYLRAAIVPIPACFFIFVASHKDPSLVAFLFSIGIACCLSLIVVNLTSRFIKKPKQV